MECDSPVRPDQVTIGVLATVIPRDVVDEAVAVCGVGSRRADGKLPPHVTTYLTMGLILFPDEPYEDVVRRVTGALDDWGCWDAAWSPPTASAITQARKRLGARVMAEIAESVFGPVAGPADAYSPTFALGRARGAFGCGRRLVAIDGFDLDLPDSGANAAEFGYAGSGANRSAFPKARVVTLTECGTRVLLAAEVGPYSVGESTMAGRIYPRLRTDELLVADRNFYSFPAWCSTSDTGAALVWRAPTGLHLAVVRVLPDGTYLTVLIDSKVRGARRERLLEAARTGGDLDPDLARLARVVEYNVTDREGSATGEAIVVLSTLVDPAEASAEQVAVAYQRRWEHETGNGEIKTHPRGPAAVLRSLATLATLATAADFGPLLKAEALRHGADHVRQIVFLGDGAAWIWNLANKILPAATQIVDLYHARQHVHEIADAVAFMLTDREQWLAERLSDLDEGRIEDLLAAAEELPMVGVKAIERDKTLTYFKTNAHRMRYAHYRDLGMFVGSGVVEAGCKAVVGQRLKLAGMRWTELGATGILALRTQYAAAEHQQIWHVPHNQNPAADLAVRAS